MDLIVLDVQLDIICSLIHHHLLPISVLILAHRDTSHYPIPLLAQLVAQPAGNARIKPYVLVAFPIITYIPMVIPLLV